MKYQPKISTKNLKAPKLLPVYNSNIRYNVWQTCLYIKIVPSYFLSLVSVKRIFLWGKKIGTNFQPSKYYTAFILIIIMTASTTHEIIID